MVCKRVALKELDWQAPRGRVSGLRRPGDPAIMCQVVLQDPAFFKFLLRINQDRAATVPALGCADCAGPLHAGNFERKPRGPLRDPMVSKIRISFSCGHCRQRCMPASVRFLGRRVYWGAVVLLATALCSGLSLRRGRQLTQQLGVPVLTLLRWRHWWLSEFARTAVWQELRGKLLPPLAASELPAGLLQRVLTGDTPTAMAMILRWLAPLSTVTEGRSMCGALTQKMALARAVLAV